MHAYAVLMAAALLALVITANSQLCCINRWNRGSQDSKAGLSCMYPAHHELEFVVQSRTRHGCVLADISVLQSRMLLKKHAAARL